MPSEHTAHDFHVELQLSCKPSGVKPSLVVEPMTSYQASH